MTINMLLATMLAAAQPATPATTDRVVDVSDARAVAALLKEAGYKAEIKTDSGGESYIVSSAGGNEFRVIFYGCTHDANCDSLQFYSWFKKEPFFSQDMANEWNKEWRFLKVAIDKDGDLSEYMDISAIGKMTYANFRDYIDWYESMDSKLITFVSDKRKAAPAK